MLNIRLRKIVMRP